MKKQLLLFISLSFFYLKAQNLTSVPFCGQHTVSEKLFKDQPEELSRFKANQEILKTAFENYEQTHQEGERAIYTIPIVFHIIHFGGPEDIDDAQVLDALEVLNRDFRALNPDLANVNSNFSGITADIEIQFELAKKDNFGNCINGITRTYSPATSGNMFEQVDAVQSIHGDFPGSKYMNVFVVQSADGAAGFTIKPGYNISSSMAGGIYLQHLYLGRIGTSSEVTSRALTHEVGHWLNLSHTWGDSNDPGLAANCNEDDGIYDTPETLGWTSCNVNGSSCGSLDNVENYMEYSYCSKMFTTGQRNAMRTALESNISNRRNLWSTNNLNATGVNSAPVLCKADFSSSTLETCENKTVQFKDRSYANPISWNWNFGPNAIPSTSNEQNPVVTFTTAGFHTVQLTVSDGVSTLSETKTDYIRILFENGEQPVYNEGFENLDIENSQWTVNNGTWFSTIETAHSGSKALKLLNYLGQEGQQYSITTPPLDLSYYLSTPSISFKYAYKKKSSTSSDRLLLQASDDCGNSWTNLRNLPVTFLTTATGSQSGNWYPTSTDEWKTSFTNIPVEYQIPNARFRFVIINGGGNNFYLDDINIEGSVSIEEKEIFNSFTVAPNPTQQKAYLNYELKRNANDLSYTIYDLTGRTLDQVSLNNQTRNEIEIDLSNYVKGYYILKLQVDGVSFSKKIIKE